MKLVPDVAIHLSPSSGPPLIRTVNEHAINFSRSLSFLSTLSLAPLGPRCGEAPHRSFHGIPTDADRVGP